MTASLMSERRIEMPFDRNASMSLTATFQRLRFAVIRTLLDELDRAHRKGDWRAADAVSRQLTEELEILAVVLPAVVV
jgi:hypothetical protein